MRKLVYIALILWGIFPQMSYAQFSPGKLSQAHAEFEGLDNCTLCHEIGAQVSEAKCLECHKEMQSLLDAQRGYHASKEVQEKACIDCHSEHHGRKFDAVRFDQDNFDHDLTGYNLEAAHNRIDCRDCHKPDYIQDSEIALREGTFIGLEESCLTCHIDYHQEELGGDCLSCHNYNQFEETPGFDHDDTEFPLKGAHQEVSCLECHPMEVREGRDFQKFSNLEFEQCIDCHDDIHDGKFGTNCTDCHSENSWSQLQNTHRFNHDLTDYPLEGLHRSVACAECHLGSDFARPLAFGRCTDCHDDYHEGEIESLVSGVQDCDDCHQLYEDFSWSSYGWTEHEESDFPLEGAHLATPCFACHKESEESRWDFAFESHNCVSCHDDVHQGFIDSSYYPAQDCQACHNSETWASISFDHESTGWELVGAHAQEDCRACHYEGEVQRFNSLNSDCIQCHENVHGDQFEGGDQADCTQCHKILLNWNADNFDHQETQFPLEGKHAQVDCSACHKTETQSNGVELVIYKIKEFECIDCHGT